MYKKYYIITPDMQINHLFTISVKLPNIATKSKIVIFELIIFMLLDTKIMKIEGISDVVAL